MGFWMLVLLSLLERTTIVSSIHPLRSHKLTIISTDHRNSVLVYARARTGACGMLPADSEWIVQRSELAIFHCECTEHPKSWFQSQARSKYGSAGRADGHASPVRKFNLVRSKEQHGHRRKQYQPKVGNSGCSKDRTDVEHGLSRTRCCAGRRPQRSLPRGLSQDWV